MSLSSPGPLRLRQGGDGTVDGGCSQPAAAVVGLGYEPEEVVCTVTWISRDYS